jgi:hypothetical protein
MPTKFVATKTRDVDGKTPKCIHAIEGGPRPSGRKTSTKFVATKTWDVWEVRPRSRRGTETPGKVDVEICGDEDMRCSADGKIPKCVRAVEWGPLNLFQKMQ